MVWGLLPPSTFGPFFPPADFEGVVPGTSKEAWRERLNQYYAQLTADEQKKLYVPKADLESHYYASFVLRKFRDEIGSVSHEHSFPLSPILDMNHRAFTRPKRPSRHWAHLSRCPTS
jgi:hypothetical protein